ncbi:MAG: hypothetical protein R6W70_07425 [bacterium]
MRFLPILFLFLLFTTVLSGAEVTDVASAVEYNDPLDVNLDIYYNNLSEFFSLKREYNSQHVLYEGNGGYYSTTDSRRVETIEYKGNPDMRFLREINLAAEIGVYRDLSISFAIPFVLKDRTAMIYNSAVEGPVWDSSLPRTGFFPYAGNLNYNHSGVGDISFGINYAPFNQKRRNNNFSGLLGFDVTFPTARIATPEGMNSKDSDGNVISSGKNGNVGKGLFVFELRTAVSKRYEISEPYGMFTVSLPVPSSSSIYKNPKYSFKMNSGTEFIPWEQADKNRKVTIRTDIEMLFTTRGNAYNAVTDARWAANLTEPGGYNPDDEWDILPREDGWFQLSGMIKPMFMFVEYVSFGGYFSVGYRQKHYLTDARPDEAGYIAGLDDEKYDCTHCSGNTGAEDGGRLLSESHILLGWGFYLSGHF